MHPDVRSLVRSRAGDCCEYCRLPQAATPLVTFHAEHVVAKQHASLHDPDNLALACDRCNAYKGPNLTSIDPESGEVVLLFHPRQDVWSEHFALEGGRVIGRTATARATVRLLNMNAPRRVELRQAWLLEEDIG